MGVDSSVIAKLASRLADDVVMAGLPAPGRCRVLMDVAGTRFGVKWDVDHGFRHKPGSRHQRLVGLRLYGSGVGMGGVRQGQSSAVAQYRAGTRRSVR
jgi:hypothetical protein